MDFSFLKDDSKTRLVIAGQRDDYGPVEEIMKIVEKDEPLAAGKNHIGRRSFFRADRRLTWRRRWSQP